MNHLIYLFFLLVEHLQQKNHTYWELTLLSLTFKIYYCMYPSNITLAWYEIIICTNCSSINVFIAYFRIITIYPINWTSIPYLTLRQYKLIFWACRSWAKFMLHKFGTTKKGMTGIISSKLLLCVVTWKSSNNFCISI